ncbi:hypothetical protein M885DRAFT_524058 [Pelagophyceae sp. CCMP2097]|nr:hypothetical protein M885DRAFT_524058 [Pelagophyceae sp. CCMP2097]
MRFISAAVLFAVCEALVAPGVPSRRGAVIVQGNLKSFTKTGPVKPRSPRPSQLFDSPEKLARVTQTLKRNYGNGYDAEYDEEIRTAKRKLLELRLRKSQRLPFKPHEFAELRKFVAQLKTAQRTDELKAQGHNPLLKKARTRRERTEALAKKIGVEKKRAYHRRRLDLLGDQGADEPRQLSLEAALRG